MKVDYMGTVTRGSATLVTSVANAEVITVGERIYNFSFMNDGNCTIIVNNGTPLYIRDGQGIFVPIVFSFKVVTAGITYNWTGMLG